MYTRLFVFMTAFFVFIVLCAPNSNANSPSFETSSLEIMSSTGIHRFTVELATTPEQQTYGLQFREELAEHAGMLFDFAHYSIISMWMRNTLISLDMIFIDQKGRIQRIEQGTQPRSLKIISSETPSWAVLELAGGTSSRLGIKPGDKIMHHIFKN